MSHPATFTHPVDPPSQLAAQHAAHKARQARLRQTTTTRTAPIFRQAEISTIEAVPFNPLPIDTYWRDMWFGDLVFGGPRTEYVSIQQVLTAVAKHFGLTVQQIRSDSRTYAITLPRQIGYYLARQFTKISVEEIARQFNRDHSSACHGIKKIQRMVDAKHPILEDIAKISRALGR